MTEIDRVFAGQKIRAEHLNALAEAMVRRIVAGQGLVVQQDGGRVTIGLSQGAGPVGREARIVEVVTPAEPLERTALNTTYWAARVGLADTEAIAFPVERIFGRPNYNGDAVIEPAREGDSCWIRDRIGPGGAIEPELIVRTEVFAVTPACSDSLRSPLGPGAAGAGASGIGGGLGDGLGDGLAVVEGVLAVDGEEANAMDVVDAMDAMAGDHLAEIEIPDFAEAGYEEAVPVPRWARTASLHLVGKGDLTDAPLCQLDVGTSNIGASAAFLGDASLTLGGGSTLDERNAMAGPIAVEARGYLHVRVATPDHGTAVGSGMVYVRFA